jgi:DNA-binding MarR family transcriptional regulator
MTEKTPPSLTQLVGQAEQAFGALMRQVLAETGGTFHQWVTLSVLAGSGGTLAGTSLYDRVTGALKIDRALVQTAVDELTAGGYVSDGEEISLTDTGRSRFGLLRGAIQAATAPLYEGMSDDDVVVAGRVLKEMTARANALIAKH